MAVQNTDIWVITTCGCVNLYGRFGSYTASMIRVNGKLRFSEASVTFSETTWCHILEDVYLQATTTALGQRTPLLYNKKNAKSPSHPTPMKNIEIKFAAS